MEHLGIRIVVYCDDLVFMDKNRDELINVQSLILRILEEFGWKISENKPNLQIAQELQFFCQLVNSNQDHIQITQERNTQMLNKCVRWSSIVQKKAWVKIKLLASFVESLNFLRLQIKRGRLYLRKLNRIKQQIANCKGWNAYLYINLITIEEIYLLKVKIVENIPVKASIQTPKAIVITDASQDSWGATLKPQNPDEEIWIQGDWCKKQRLLSSNQRESAAILCGQTSSKPHLKSKPVTFLKIESKSYDTSYILNRRAAAASLCNMIDRILKIEEDHNIQIHSIHIKWKSNIIPDSISRLAIS
ncbi:MAG: hypothetical protein EZS28_021426 [Streblomastix strix]|uniref:Reverse transcriptase domain-containing protein n=1 Tax=Streblomastix strix TaxID=222440 RepID=A0A5J4VKC2_9EUKA|nr:MAG: hypothetical protein EZS28_021426 [Streblomastix strix]